MNLKYTKYDAGKSFLLALFSPYVVLILIMTVFGLLTMLTKNDAIKEGIGYDIATTLSSQVGFLILFFVYNKVYKINVKTAMPYSKKINFKTYLILILISVVMILGLNYFLGIFDYIFNYIGYSQPTSLALPLTNFWWYLLSVFALAILPAISEELIFRGMIFGGLKQYGKTIAVVGSALLFSLMHTSPLQTIYPFIFGVILAIVVLVTNNIFTAIFLHFFNNLLVITTEFISNITQSTQQMPSFVITLLLGISIALVAGFAIFALLRLLKRVNENKDNNIAQSEDDEKLQKNGKKNISLWLGVAVGCILWITVFVTYM